MVFFLIKNEICINYEKRYKGKIQENDQSMIELLHHTRRIMHKGLVNLRIYISDISSILDSAPLIVVQSFGFTN